MASTIVGNILGMDYEIVGSVAILLPWVLLRYPIWVHVIWGKLEEEKATILFSRLGSF